MNDGSRETFFIDPGKADELIKAMIWAWIIDRPLNYYVTVRLPRHKKSFTEFNKGFTAWYYDRTGGESPYYIYVLKNPPGKIFYLNLLVHLPRHLQKHKRFKKLSKNWLIKEGVLPVTNKSVSCKPVHFSHRKTTDFDFIHRGQVKMIRYLIKGTPPDDCLRYGVEHEYQGSVIGKRCGRSLSFALIPTFLDSEQSARFRLFKQVCDEISFPIPHFDLEPEESSLIDFDDSDDVVVRKSKLIDYRDSPDALVLPREHSLTY